MQKILSQLNAHPQLPELTCLWRGIEKEGLRTDINGHISQQSHPKALGKALTHEYITTDYSEALLEFITPVFSSAQEALSFLNIAHRIAYTNMEEELIWANSMPCILNGQLSIPIADYGKSNLGQLKQTYRHGLWHRYGRMMQAIAGIHYNFSLPEPLIDLLFAKSEHSSRQDFVSELYFGLIRNFRRYSWLLHYLFGASPAICTSFFEHQNHHLHPLHQHSAYLPYATSLRMSDLGYQSNAQAGLNICYNHLDSYIDTLSQAMRQPYADYAKIGIQNADGQYQQLNTHLLQIENEYYSDIRPKRVTLAGEKPLTALKERGVQYIEVRCTDLNPFLPLGINSQQIYFLDTFLLFCALTDSPKMNAEECQQVAQNSQTAVMYGRNPNIELQQHQQGTKNLRQWGLELLQALLPIAKLLDKSQHSHQFMPALNQQKLKLLDDSLTPSARFLAQMFTHKLEFAELSLQQSKQHKKQLSQPLNPQVQQHWHDIAQQSVIKNAQIEADDRISFSEYLANYWL